MATIVANTAANLSGDTLVTVENNLWASYVPVISGDLTQGNGTVTGRFVKIGGTINFVVTFTFGTTSSFAGAAATNFSLPANSALNAETAHLQVRDDSGVVFVGTAIIGSAVVSAFTMTTAGASAQLGVISNTSPIAWDAGDILVINGTYEAA